MNFPYLEEDFECFDPNDTNNLYSSGISFSSSTYFGNYNIVIIEDCTFESNLTLINIKSIKILSSKILGSLRL